MAKDFHFDGIEVRGLGHDLYAYRAAPFAPGQIDKTMSKMAQLLSIIHILDKPSVREYEDPFKGSK